MKTIIGKKEMHNFVSERYDLHLGVGDKYLLNRFYPEYSKKTRLGIERGLPLFLIGFGYNSKRLGHF